MVELRVGNVRCTCDLELHEPKLVALTGGPGAGKTAVLEAAARSFCSHVAILPEAASIVFGGGFPRHETSVGRCAAQRAIYHVQREVECLVLEERRVAIGLCDRGTLDGLAYWPGADDDYWRQVGTTREEELGRYEAVIHLEPPSLETGYRQSELRVETVQQSKEIDRRIVEVWRGHPRFTSISSRIDFISKATTVLETLRAALPSCCRSHTLSTGTLRGRRGAPP